MREQDYITLAREATRNLWNSYQTLKGLQDEWNAQDYGNTLPVGEGANEGITKTMIGSVVFDTTNAINTSVMAAGHATNVTNLL